MKILLTLIAIVIIALTVNLRLTHGTAGWLTFPAVFSCLYLATTIFELTLGKSRGA